MASSHASAATRRIVCLFVAGAARSLVSRVAARSTQRDTPRERERATAHAHTEREHRRAVKNETKIVECDPSYCTMLQMLRFKIAIHRSTPIRVIVPPETVTDTAVRPGCAVHRDRVYTPPRLATCHSPRKAPAPISQLVARGTSHLIIPHCALPWRVARSFVQPSFSTPTCACSAAHTRPSSSL